jgi:hypothetical protein
MSGSSNAQLAAVSLRAQGYECPDRPVLPADASMRELWPRLLDEEVQELRDAIAANDLVGVADALADVLYVAYQAAASYGIPIDDVFAEVHRSNLTKVGPDGEVERRADGKTLKPAGYSPPNLAPIVFPPEAGGAGH